MINIPNIDSKYATIFVFVYVISNCIIPYLIAKVILNIGIKREAKILTYDFNNLIYAKYMSYLFIIYIIFYLLDKFFWVFTDNPYFVLVLSPIFETLLLVVSLCRARSINNKTYRRIFLIVSVVFGLFLFARITDFLLVVLLLMSIKASNQSSL